MTRPLILAHVPAALDESPAEEAAPPPDPQPETAGAVVMCEASDWSYFDPAKSRFVALLAKLDEIAARKA